MNGKNVFIRVFIAIHGKLYFCSLRFCPHGVYDKEKAPVPVVVNPAACIDHCRGCAGKCPAGAISYVGDYGEAEGAACGCCSCGE